MTCIVAVRSSKGLYIGGDSAATAGTMSQRTLRPKVFQNGAYLMGYTSSFRMGQVLEHVFQPPEPSGGDLYAQMVAEFVPAVRACLKDAGFSKIENNEETGGQFLVATGGRIFEVEIDFSVLEMSEPFAAVGCGTEVALGALHVFEKADRLDGYPREAIRAALGASARFSGAVRPPFHVLALRASK